MSLDEEVQEMARIRENGFWMRIRRWGMQKKQTLKESIEKEIKDMIEKMWESGMTEERIQKILYS